MVQPTTANLAVIGLGAMGSRAAIALNHKHRVRGYDPMSTAREQVAAEGVPIAASPADAAGGAELILLSLPGPGVVRSVIDQLGAAVDGKIIADLSTIDPATAQDLATTLRPRGISYVDAPVLGRPAGCGAWTLPCGGDPTAIADLRAVAVDSIAGSVQRVGDSGAGATLKLCNNLMFAAINTVTAEVIDLAERAGLDPALFAEVVASSGAATVSPLFAEIAPRMADRNYADPTFTVRLLAKDVGLGAGLADALQCRAPITRLVQLITGVAVADGSGDLDTAAVVESYRRAAGVLQHDAEDASLTSQPEGKP